MSLEGKSLILLQKLKEERWSKITIIQEHGIYGRGHKCVYSATDKVLDCLQETSLEASNLCFIHCFRLTLASLLVHLFFSHFQYLEL